MTTKEIKKLVEGELGYRININSRKRDIVYGRAIYFKICKDRTNLSLKKIGETLNQDHATVLHSIRNIFPTFEMYKPNLNLSEINKDAVISHKYMEIYNRIIATEEYIPKYKRLKTLQDQHKKLETRFKFLKQIKIDPNLKPLLETIQEIPQEKLPEANKRIKRVVERLKEFCE
jgi:predicted DNA-binding protein YlxM (UPF0122 family)